MDASRSLEGGMSERLSPIGVFPYSPYCGAPPSPGELLQRWNLDPFLISVLALILAAYLLSGRSTPTWRRLSFCAGWLLGSLAVISPLCPLSVALFSARVGQHLILTSLVAPLIALGWRVRPTTMTSSRWPPILAAITFASLLWIWHSPAPYVATFTTDTVYWLMHLTTFGSAVWLWYEVFSAWGERIEAAAAAIVLTILQMGLLGAVITFADRPLYAPHLYTAPLWGLSALEDQQLGGVLMWVPAGVILAAALAAGFTEALRRAEQRALARSAV
jgi:putative membrane protein